MEYISETKVITLRSGKQVKIINHVPQLNADQKRAELQNISDVWSNLTLPKIENAYNAGDKAAAHALWKMYGYEGDLNESC